MTPQEYCKQKAAASGSSFYYSFMFLPKARREAITALYAFCREVDDIADECQDIEIARKKLAWWRSEISNLYAGKQQHPVTNALAKPVKDYDLQEQHFQEIIDGMEMDLNQSRYVDFEELKIYCYRVASVVGILAASIFGYSKPGSLLYAQDLGLAFQLTNIVRDVGEDARRDRIYLPLEELEKFGVSEHDILQGHESEKVKQLLDFQIERAESYYNQAFSQLPEEDHKTQRTGLIMAAIYRAVLEEIKLDGAQKVLNSRTSLTPLRKLWLAWITWVKN
jgi:phytoene synthase